MPDDERKEGDRERHRYRVVDTETDGVYIVVSATGKSAKEIEEIIAGVIKDEGRVRERRVRTIFL